MKSWKFWSSTFLALLIIWSFQNCSSDNFATQGNGTPYEGISIGPDGPVGPEPPIDHEEDNDPPASGNAGSQSPPADQLEMESLELQCFFTGSSLFSNLAFGTNPDGQSIMLLNFADRTQTGRVLDTTMARQVPMDFTHASGNHIDLIIYGTDSASITYTNTNKEIVTSMTNCD